MLSKIVHFLTALPSPSHTTIKELNNVFYSFLWKGKPDPIKRTIAIRKLQDGGLGMVDLGRFNESLKLTWIRKLLLGTSRWKTLIENKYPLILNIQNFGNAYMTRILNGIKNPFWKDVLVFLQSFICNYNLKSLHEVEACSFLYNENIKIGKETIKTKLLIENGIYFIRQLKNGNIFLSHREFLTKYNIRLNFLSYHSMITSVKRYCSKFEGLKLGKQPNSQPYFELLMKTTKGASPIYEEMITKDSHVKGQSKWTAALGITVEQWKNSFPFLKSTTKDTKLRWFQFRILHHILSTNRSVSKFKTDQNDRCTFCGAHSETILHLLWQCKNVQKFWKELANLLNTRCTHTHNFSFNQNLVLFGQANLINTDKICNIIILFAKFFIYKSKVQHLQLNIRFFIKELYTTYCTQKHIQRNSTEFQNAWGPYLKMFQSLL